MKKTVLSIFVFCLVAFSAVFFMLLSNSSNNFENHGKVEASPDGQVVVNVQESVKLTLGESQLLFLTAQPKLESCKVSFAFSKPNIATVITQENGQKFDYYVKAVGVGEAVCTITVEHQNIKTSKLVDIQVVERYFEFDYEQQEVFYSGLPQGSNLYKTYKATIKSNFPVNLKTHLEKSENIELLSSSHAGQTPGEHQFYNTVIYFYIKSGSNFYFKIDNAVYAKSCTPHAYFQPKFSKGNFDESTQTLFLHTNIQNEQAAQQSGVFASASFEVDLNKFDIVVAQQNIIQINKGQAHVNVRALNQGSDVINVFSKTDASFSYVINVIVKPALAKQFEVFENNQKITLSALKLEVGKQIELELRNVAPSYISMEGAVNFNFVCESGNIFFDVQTKTLTAKAPCFATLEIVGNNIKQTIEIEAIKTKQQEPDQPEPEQIVQLQLTKLDTGQTYQINQGETTQINLESNLCFVFNLCLKLEGEIISSQGLILRENKHTAEDEYYIELPYLYIKISNNQVLYFEADRLVFTVEFVFC